MKSKSTPRSSEYAKLLLDPRWQKLRLEALGAADWKCAWCSSGLNDGVTLHVHHRQYFKGRKPWEYAVGQLEVLCATCHEGEHGEDDDLLVACSYIGRDTIKDRMFAASLIAGLSEAHLHDVIDIDPDPFLIGQLASHIPATNDRFRVEDLARAVEAAKRNPARLFQALVRFADEELGGQG